MHRELIGEAPGAHIIRVTDPCKPLEIDLSRPLEIEVGCGKGQFLTRRAAENPECNFLGIERMLERVRLFGPLFRTALWKRLEVGGKLEFATDHKEYFDEVCEGFATDARYERVDPMPRPKEVWTEFETMFREQGLPIYSAAWKSLPGDDTPLAPLTIPPEAEPREGIIRRT